MLERIEEPLALATVTWLTTADGGRRSGPPTAPVYATTATFRTGGGGPAEHETSWPASDSPTLSVFLERVEAELMDTEVMTVDFIAREQALPYVHAGADMVVLEGPREVARARITGVLIGPD